MKTKQFNLKIPVTLAKKAEQYVKDWGYRNIQDLALEGIREKIFGRYDNDFTDKEIALIDELITNTIAKKDFVSEEEMNKVLLE